MQARLVRAFLISGPVVKVKDPWSVFVVRNSVF